uniref:Uncharacterized protein n=1 Tax=Meleagris gallopavo TaxID=9103 RepID=A0A803YFW8_MELGA
MGTEKVFLLVLKEISLSHLSWVFSQFCELNGQHVVWESILVLVSTSTNSMQNVRLCMQGEGKCQPELQVALWRGLHLSIDLGRNQVPSLLL